MWKQQPWNKKKIEIQGISITFTQSVRAKRINLIVSLEGVKVSVPHSGSFKEAKTFVNSKMEWVKQSLNEIEKRKLHQTIFKPNIPFKTKYHQLQIVKKDIKIFRGLIKNGIIEVQIPVDKVIEEQDVQIFIRKSIDKVLYREAKEYLPVRLQKLANQSGLSYKKVSFRNPKTRWGSCSNQNNISLNVQLMRLPDHLIDYVILHELAHTKVKNHSKDFWIFLERICPGSRALDKEMKCYQTQIF